jgi:hypothetical protein
MPTLRSTGSPATPSIRRGRSALQREIAESPASEPSPARNVLQKDADPLTEATVIAAERFQTQVLQSGSEAFIHLIATSLKTSITKRMKAYRQLLAGHIEFWDEGHLKTLEDLSLDNFVKLIRIMYGQGEAGNLSSASLQILKLFSLRPLTFFNYDELEEISIKACLINETYSLSSDAQRDIVTQLIKQARHQHPAEHPNHSEAKSILDRVQASKSTATIEEFTDQLLLLLCDNKTRYAEAMERGLRYDLTLPPSSNLATPSDTEPPTKRNKSLCFACGRSGHLKAECSFIEQGHPDVNKEPKPWADSTSGKAWALKGKSYLPGNVTLSGDPFSFERK